LTADVAFQIFLRLKRLELANHTVWMDNYRIPNKVMGQCFGKRGPVGKPWSRREDAVWREAVDLVQTRNWKATARDRENRKLEIGEAMTENEPKGHMRT
jgi:hypothetical protein